MPADPQPSTPAADPARGARAETWVTGLALLAGIAGLATWGLSALREPPPLRAIPAHAEPELVRVYNGAQAGDVLGSWIASGVDLDHDGVPESLAGAPEDDSRGANRGRAAVFSGRTGEVLFELFGDAEGAFLGERVGFDPDVDGDGAAEVLVRARGRGASGDRVIVASGKDGHELRQLNAGRTGDELGTWLLAVPDLDGDGIGDIAVGAPGRWDAAVAGRAYVFSGATGQVLRTFSGADRPSDRFGFSMALVGDQDGDGVVDLAVSSLEGTEATPALGAVRVYSLADGRLLSTLMGTRPGDRFGHELATVPDMNGDGRPELLVGSYRPDSLGFVRAVDPLTGVVRRELIGPVRGDEFGHAVGVIGDVDGDGVDEWAVGAPNAPYAGGYVRVGRVDVISGATGVRLASFWGHREGAHFGYAIAGAGDVDGDTHAEVLVATVVEGDVPGHARIIAPAKAAPVQP